MIARHSLLSIEEAPQALFANFPPPSAASQLPGKEVAVWNDAQCVELSLNRDHVGSSVAVVSAVAMALVAADPVAAVVAVDLTPLPAGAVP